MSEITTPFGVTITTDDILESLAFLDSWEERYKYIIDLGKALAPMEVSKKIDKNRVRGCQSQVWIEKKFVDDVLYFDVDSDAFIVKGLLSLVLAAYNAKTPEQILSFDIEHYFEKLSLIKHLSPTRGNGIRAMVKNIRDTASSCLQGAGE